MKNIATYDKSTRQLVEELMAAFDAVSTVDEQDRLPELEMKINRDDPEMKLHVDRIAEALAEAYKAGLQAGHIQGLSLAQHDATESHFWYEKAWTLARRLCAQVEKSKKYIDRRSKITFSSVADNASKSD